MSLFSYRTPLTPGASILESTKPFGCPSLIVIIEAAIVTFSCSVWGEGSDRDPPKDQAARDDVITLCAQPYRVYRTCVTTMIAVTTLEDFLQID